MITNWSQHILEKRVTKISSNYLVAGQAYAQSSQDQGRNQIVHGVYLRCNFTLVGSASSITINNEDARQNLLSAFMSQIQITGSRAGVRGDLVQRMSLGEHYQALRGCGVLPVCPQLFEAGFGSLPQQPRAGGSATSTLVTLVYPLVPADLGPEFGSIFALGSEQLGGLNFSFTFGSFSWTDSAGATFTIGAADGAPGATIDAEIIYR